MLPLVYQFGKSWWIVVWFNLGLSLLTLFPLLFLIRESPKFYVSVSKFQEARLVYEHIAKLNKKPMFHNRLEGEERVAQDGEQTIMEQGIKELVRVKSLWVPLAVVPFIWFVVSVTGEGMTLAIGNLAGSIYTNGYFNASANLVALFFAGPIANCLGRKKSMILSLGFGGLSPSSCTSLSLILV